jgi:hypothetical protein
MGVDGMSQAALDYDLCEYGGSRVRFRGPAKPLDRDFVAFLGGTDTFGRFIPKPFPALVEERIGVDSVNLGVVNAGADLYLKDGASMAVAQRARAVVLQVPGAANLTNRYYSVHPRRNDRFLRATPMLEALYPEIDFTEFHFVRHMLASLAALSPQRFRAVRDELRITWQMRMTRLVATIERPVILLWLSRVAPQDHADDVCAPEPALVDGRLLDALRASVSETVGVVSARDETAGASIEMLFEPHEAAAAAETLGPAAHREAAAALVDPLRRVLARN